MDDASYSVIKGGIAIGARRFAPYNGTAGMIVNYQGKRMVLSCYHVLAPDNHFRNGDEIGQPSSGNRVARLREAVIDNTVDAALAEIDKPENSINEIHELHQRGIQPRKFAEKSDIVNLHQNGGQVLKRGIMTGITKGRIVDVRASVEITFPYSSRKHTLEDQLRIESLTSSPFSQEGDSGSCVVTFDGTIIGLVVGGIGQNGYVTPVYNLLNHFGGLSI